MRASARHRGMVLMASVLAAGLLIAPSTASAQWGRDRDDYRGEYRYGRTMPRDLGRLIQRAEQSSNEFRHFFEREWREAPRRDPRGRYDRDWRYDRNDRYDRDDQLKVVIQRMDEALENLRRSYNRSDSHREVSYQVERIMREARSVDRLIMDRRRGSAGLMGRWSRVRADLNALASAVGVPRV